MQNWVKIILSTAGCVFATGVASAADTKPAPTIDFLEFLAEWETEDGIWLDPMLLDPATSGSEEVGEPASDSESKP